MAKAKSRNEMQIHAVMATIRDWQDAREAFDEAMAEKLGLIVAERRCLVALLTGPKAAGILAQASGLTPAAATSMIDRLEKRGFVERQRDDQDRRKVFVALTRPASETLSRFYAPQVEATETLLSGFSVEELATVQRFVSGTLDLQNSHLERVRNEPVK
jgi:DNA-binding MarR family transcriptional regulator